MLVIEEKCGPDHLIEMINKEATGKAEDICSILHATRSGKINPIAIRDFKNRLGLV